MEAHSLLKRQGFDVASYGTGAHVKLPSPSLREPNVYDFGTPYKQVFDDLRRKDPELSELARRSELATRTRWKIAEAFLVAAPVVGCWEWSSVSSAQSVWMSLKEEKEKGEDGDDVQ